MSRRKGFIGERKQHKTIVTDECVHIFGMMGNYTTGVVKEIRVNLLKSCCTRNPRQ